MTLSASGALSNRFGGVLLNSMAYYWGGGGVPQPTPLVTSFLFPRVILVARQVPSQTVGTGGYSGISQGGQSTIVAGMIARIQEDTNGPATRATLPGDAIGESVWRIIFKAPKGTVRSRDFIADELGNEYQVISVRWGPLVTTVKAQIMET